MILATAALGCARAPVVLGAETGTVATTEVPTELVSADAWTLLEGADDPFDGEVDVPCTPLDFGAEPGGFEVRTDACDGATFAQPLLADLAQGDRVEVGLSHLDLWSADEGATADLVLGLGEVELWHATLPIPEPAGVVLDEVSAPVDAAAGDAIWYRVQNHGTNSYVLSHVVRLSHRR